MDRAEIVAALRSGEALTLGLATDRDALAAYSWKRVYRCFADHVATLPEGLDCRGWRCTPVRLGSLVVGLTAEAPAGDTDTVFLVPEARGLGLGDYVLEQLDEAGRSLAAPEGSFLARYIIARGFRQVDRQAGLVRLLPPSRRRDLRPAASVCLAHPSTDQLLLGRRLTPPWLGYWAFPGGSREAGEALLETARRELEEETGIHLQGNLEPVASNTVYVASGDGTRAYSVTNYLFLTDGRHPPTPTVEFDAAWLNFEDAVGKRPMTAGTRRVLRKVSAQLGH